VGYQRLCATLRRMAALIAYNEAVLGDFARGVVARHVKQALAARRVHLIGWLFCVSVRANAASWIIACL